MRFKSKFVLHILLIVMIFFLSCRKFVEIPGPQNQLPDLAVFSDSVDATAAVLGIYISMMQGSSLNIGDGGLTLYPGLSSDELYNTTNDVDENGFYNNAIATNSSTNASGLWGSAYTLIYGVNACLQGIRESTGIASPVKNQLNGELKFIRAFEYFNLVNLYGGVPLVLSTDYLTNQILPRAQVDSIYDEIFADLTEAQNLLTANYNGQGRFRPNLFTATALLSKVYLYRGKWQEAEDASTQIINSGMYGLESNLNDVFKATDDSEAIWKLSAVYKGIETWEAYYFVPPSSQIMPRYIITDRLLSSFEPGDQRGIDGNWVKSNLVNGKQYYFPYKYKFGYDGLTAPIENYIVFRIAEQYLIRAEARTHLGKITGVNSAEEDLNLVRHRAGLPNTAASTTENMLLAIEHERQVELFCEWGNRWFDLKRTERADAVLGPVKPDWQASDDLLYPIPQSETDKNPFLTQNQGY